MLRRKQKRGDEVKADAERRARQQLALQEALHGRKRRATAAVLDRSQNRWVGDGSIEDVRAEVRST
jgi:hypothetical protein